MLKKKNFQIVLLVAANVISGNNLGKVNSKCMAAY